MTEEQRLLMQASEEIRGLRRENEILRAKVGVMEFFQVVLHTSPAYPSQGMGEDVVWKMQKRLDEIAEEQLKRAA